MFDAIPQNYRQYLDYAPLFLISVTTAFLLTPIMGIIARKLKILGFPPSMRKGQRPSDFRHLEKQPTPLLGGIAVIFPLVVLTLANSSPTPQLSALLVSIVILAIMGVIDDIHELSGYTQLAVQILVALFLAASVIDLPSINNPLGEIIYLDAYSLTGSFLGFDIRFLIPGDILLIGWILTCTISVKISSGTDGLMEGNSLIAAIIFFLLSIRFQNAQTATISIILAGLLCGLLFFNFYPAKIWSGSSGKSSLGFTLAVLSVLSGAKLATAIIILLLPITDFFLVTIGRVREHRPKNPLSLLTISDRTHLHHKLMDLGFSERKVAFFEYFVTGVLGAVALAVTGTLKAFTVFSIILLVTGLVWSISMYAKKNGKSSAQKPEDESSPEARFSY